MNNYQANAKRLLITILMLIIVIFGLFAGTLAYAEIAPQTKFEQINVLDDLPDNFDFSKYPSGDIHTPGVFQVVEYCYSPFKSKQGNYGIYIYFYNPHNTKFNERSKQNQVEIATDFDEKLSPINYQKFDLKFCNKSETSNQYNKFLKFKILNAEKLLKTVNSEVRKYAVSGIELLEEGQQLAPDYSVGGIYTFSGYAKGYGLNEDDNTLVCNVDKLETIRIASEDIGQTSYNFKANNEKGAGWHNQINAVYFSVPNKILDEYGRLQKVKFQTYKYKTAPILVTKNREDFDLFYNNRGKRNGTEWNCEDTFIANGLKSSVPGGGGLATTHGDIAFGKSADTVLPIKDSILRVTQLPYVFERDFPTDSDDRFLQVISSKELLNYIYRYDASNYKGYIPHRNITKDLFIESTEDPLIKDEVDAGEQNSLTNISFASGWDKFWKDLFGIKPDSAILPINPIERISNDYNTDTLYINPNDINEFNNKMDTAKLKNRSMHMFRFAIDDYYSSYVKKIGALNSLKKTDMFMAQTTAYLDFDILELTFVKDGIYTMFPVVMSPIDVVSGINSPSEKLPDGFPWELIILIILLILLLPLIIFLLPSLCKLVVMIVSVPFKALKAIFGGKKKSKSNSSNTLHIVTHDTVGDKKKKKRGQTSYKGERIYKLDNASTTQQAPLKPPKVKKSKSPKARKTKQPKVKKVKSPKSKHG